MPDRTSPNPSWRPGDRVASPVGAMITRDFTTLPPGDRYRLMIGSIVPRPIAFVSTRSPEGVGNLAPFSFFNGVSSDPPCVSIAVTRRADGAKKDTLLNVERTGELVICTVADWMAEPMNQCSADYPSGVDEMEAVGLTPLPSVRVRPPRVAESPVHMECRVEQLVEVGPPRLGGSTLVIARIELMHVHAPALRDGRIVFDELRPVSRIAGDGYALPPETFTLKRPKL
jgi:flavin reductase (DIM6/NTAB) family NADH-FMN oxidoreductase RutF